MDDFPNDTAVRVWETVCRRMEGHVSFDFRSPWQLGWPGEEDSKQDNWNVERRHLVVTRSRVSVLPARAIPVIIDPDGDVDDPGDGDGGGRRPPERDTSATTP